MVKHVCRGVASIMVKHVCRGLVVIWCLTSPVAAQFMRDGVQVRGGSPAEVFDWPVTATITRLELADGKIRLDHTKRGQWTPVDIDGRGTLQESTLWVCFRIQGTIACTGGERWRQGQTEKALTRPNDIGPGWLYDAAVWREMAHYVPADGDPVWFFVAAGNTRRGQQVVQRERSAIVEVRWHQAGGRWPPFPWVEGQVPPPPPPPPVDGPPPPIPVLETGPTREQWTWLLLTLADLARSRPRLEQDELRTVDDLRLQHMREDTAVRP